MKRLLIAMLLLAGCGKAPERDLSTLDMTNPAHPCFPPIQTMTNYPPDSTGLVTSSVGDTNKVLKMESDAVLTWSEPSTLPAVWTVSTSEIVNWQTMTNSMGWSRGMAYAGQPVSTNVLTILTNDAYLVGYSEQEGCPLWVCYSLISRTTNEAPPRPKVSFKTDKRTTVRVKTSDYDNTGYDRGHMAPSYGIGLCYGTNAQIQTFLMSNVIPQTPEMNRGLWKNLEQIAADKWANERNKIWVVTGPVFIGTNYINGVRVPAGSFKVFIDEAHGNIEMQAFLMPQEPREDATLGLYLTSVDEIERQTGLDFFSELPDDIEDKVERGTW